MEAVDRVLRYPINILRRERMNEIYEVAIIGSGPGGLSAAVTAAKQGLSHIMLERTDHLSDTLYKYQKGKGVMAHPVKLPLQADVHFDEDNRETILGWWNDAVRDAGTNVVYNSEVTGVTGQKGDFTITVKDGPTYKARHVILGIGLQGNIRLLGVPGQDRPWVQYQLDDPDEYHNERITVVGAGDAGIENALALATHNDLTIVNREKGFIRAKPANVAAIQRLINSGKMKYYEETGVTRVDDDAIILATPDGEVRVPCERIIARIGAIPPRRFVESCGIQFPSRDPAAVPELSPTYESNVPGLYIIGALAGYTLIKQAMNQGYEVAMRLAAKPVAPADEPLLAERFAKAFPNVPVDDVLEIIRTKVPMFAGLTTLQLREVMLESELHRKAVNETVFNRGDYTSTLFNIATGAVKVILNENNPNEAVRIEEGEFFGELGLISGRRRTATVVAASEVILVETPRRTVLRLENSVEAVKQVMDSVAIQRLVHTTLAKHRPVGELKDVLQHAQLKNYRSKEVIIAEGDPCDALYILRSGSATVTRNVDGKEIALSYVGAGGLVGERGLLDPDARRAATVRTTISSEVIRIDGEAIKALMTHMPELRKVFQVAVQQQFETTVRTEVKRSDPHQPTTSDNEIVNFLMAQGIGEATNAFIIDESLCVYCDNCEKACAETHGGVPRVNREAGDTFAGKHIPIACRHCENPHCMSDCPVDSITRAASGEVFIDDKCIGCSNCANNCPYGVIAMIDVYPEEEKSGFGVFNWILESLGITKPKHKEHDHTMPHSSKAFKCDLCKDVGTGPACVQACPTGAALRISPDEYFAFVRDGRLPDKQPEKVSA